MLNIAFVGYNARLSQIHFRWFAEDNREQIRFCDLSRGRIELYDGTRIRCIQRHQDGLRFDQIMVADDWRKEVLNKQHDLLCALESVCAHSIVPKEFRYIFYLV